MSEKLDWHLQFLLNLITNEDLEVTLTVTVGGILVSGTCINEEKYFDLWWDQFISASNIKGDQSGESTQKLKEGLKSEKFKEEGTHYIHLKDATFFTSSGKVTFPLWRGKVSEVDSFSMGALE